MRKKEGKKQIMHLCILKNLKNSSFLVLRFSPSLIDTFVSKHTDPEYVESSSMPPHKKEILATNIYSALTD